MILTFLLPLFVWHESCTATDPLESCLATDLLVKVAAMGVPVIVATLLMPGIVVVALLATMFSNSFVVAMAALMSMAFFCRGAALLRHTGLQHCCRCIGDVTVFLVVVVAVVVVIVGVGVVVAAVVVVGVGVSVGVGVGAFTHDNGAAGL